ncbi:hypothetical protein NKH48_13735 [Mesorhizobium sp. M1233]|uniref:hypothetical protein n=1 Tax=Mesorhizobium sp. M1233 TaxID=2957072 RepID=UPI003337AD97
MSEHPIIESVRADIEGLDFADDDKRQNAEDSIICTVQTLIDRLADAEKRSPPPVGDAAEAVAWRGIVEGRTAFLCRTRDEIARLASDYNATIEPLGVLPLPKAPIEPGVVEALTEALGLAKFAATLTGCRGDDDYVWGVQVTIETALAALQQEPQP